MQVDTGAPLDVDQHRPSTPPDTALRPGEIVARYKIRKLLGTGQGVEVWWAMDLPLSRHVALRLMDLSCLPPVEQRRVRVIMKRAREKSTIDDVLADLLSNRGVVAAALVDADGFVTHIRREFEIDPDALGSTAQVAFGAAVGASADVERGDVKGIIVEATEGVILLQPLADNFVLAIVGDTTATLGTIRFRLRTAVPEMNEFLR